MEDGEARQDCVHLQVVGCIEALLVLSSFVVKESKNINHGVFCKDIIPLVYHYMLHKNLYITLPISRGARTFQNQVEEFLFRTMLCM